MKIRHLITAAFSLVITSLAAAGPAVLYVSESAEKRIAVFTLDESTGELKSLGQTPTEKTPRSFWLMPGDKFVVSAGQGSNRLVVYRRDATTGALSPLKTYDCGKSPAWVLGVRF